MREGLTVILTLTEEDDKKYSKEIIHKYAKFPFSISLTRGLGKARRECIDRVVTEYCLVLDADTELPDEYLDYALWILEDNEDVAVVAIDYEKLQGHLSMGTSVWRTEVLKKLYNYDEDSKLCECIQNWHKVLQNGYIIETLPMRAIHKEK